MAALLRRCALLWWIAGPAGCWTSDRYLVDESTLLAAGERDGKPVRDARAVAAERISDGKKVFLRSRALGVPAPGADGKLVVEARAFNAGELVGAILLGVGAANVGIGAALYAFGSSSTDCADLTCSLDRSTFKTEGTIQLIGGSLLLAAGALVALIASGRRPQEVEAHREDVRYFHPLPPPTVDPAQ